MAKLEFEYDETGEKFIYLIVGFYTLAILPLSYLLWPISDRKSKNRLTVDVNDVYADGGHPDIALKHFEPCVQKRNRVLLENKEERFTTLIAKILILIILWIVLVRLYIGAIYFNKGNSTNSSNSTKSEPAYFDPYDILGVDHGASISSIRTEYKKLILVHHPDRGGNAEKFREIARAYKTLTDPASHENWERYGNPDGPGITRFGIALPKWLIEGRSAVVFIALYGLVFIIGLPAAVGTWWYRSIKYTAEKILVDTSRLYSMFLLKTPSMNIGRALIVLSCSMEFEKSHNSKIIERPSDNEDLPSLIQALSVNLNERTKEQPMCFAYSVRARTLLYTYLCRQRIPNDLLRDQMYYIVSLCPMLLCEMISITLQLIVLSQIENISHPPTIDTLENLIKLSALIVQDLEERKSPICQLPHVAETMRRLPTVPLRMLGQMEDFELRHTLKSLHKEQIRDVVNVLKCMPTITISPRFEVIDDELSDPHHITTNSVITAIITLIRKPLKVSDDLLLFERASFCDSNAVNGHDLQVFCPFFPKVKYEQWWVYIIEKKQRKFISSVKRPISLKQCDRSGRDSQGVFCRQVDVKLKFPAPPKPGTYTYQVWVRSESYLDLDTSETIKFEVHRDSDSDLMPKTKVKLDLSEDGTTSASDESSSESDSKIDSSNEDASITKKSSSIKTVEDLNSDDDYVLESDE